MVEKIPEEGYHQDIVNKAYKKWDHDIGDGKPESMSGWFEKLNEIEKDAVALGKFNQQVCNGGFSQWFGNGYAECQFEQLQQALLRLPQEEVVKKVTEIIVDVEGVAEENEWGIGSYTEEEDCDCSECGGGGFIVDENNEDIECEDCNGDGTTPYDEEYQYEDELSKELRESGFDDKYYDLEEEFLKVCEEHFKIWGVGKKEVKTMECPLKNCEREIETEISNSFCPKHENEILEVSENDK